MTHRAYAKKQQTFKLIYFILEIEKKIKLTFALAEAVSQAMEIRIKKKKKNNKLLLLAETKSLCPRVLPYAR